MNRVASAVGEFLADIRNQKLRTTLTLLGITWGTVAVVVLLAFGVGLERQTKKRFHGLGDRVVMLFGGTTTISHEGFPEGRSIRLRESDAWTLQEQIPEIERISPEYSRWNSPVRNGRQVLRPNVAGVWPDYTFMRNVIPDMGGRFINREDIDGRRRVAVLGNRARDFLFEEEAEDVDVVGRQIMIGETPFTIVGVMKPKQQSSSYSSRDRDRVFMRVYEVLGRKYRFDAADDDALGVWDTTEFEKMFEYLFTGFHLFFAIVGSFTLTVGGIGVANIMYVVVRERTREIGIKRSVGARRKDILRLFFIEATTIVLIGGTLGFALSLGLVKLVSFGDMEEFIGTPQISPAVAVVTMVLLGLVGLAAGFFPARKAAGLDPVECLRH